MDTLGVLSLLPGCPGWWLLIGHTASDAMVMAAVSVLCGCGDRCCCESPGGVACSPTHPMRVPSEWWAACCYLGDRSTPLMICTTGILLRLQGSLEEGVIKTQHSSHADSRSAAAAQVLSPVRRGSAKSSLRNSSQVSQKRSAEASNKSNRTRGITCSLYSD